MPLYKYLPFKRKRILDKLLIRFSQPGCLNDLFDLGPSFDQLSKADIARLPPGKSPGTHELPLEVVAQLLAAFGSGLERQTRNLAGRPGLFSLSNNAIARSQYDSTYGILCLAELPGDLLMWAHYADGHRGFAIQFDETHEFFRRSAADEEAGLGLRQVEYRPDRPVLSFSTIKAPDVFVRKSPDWSHEREWRVVRLLTDRTQVERENTEFPIYLFAVPPKAITGVVIGVCMPQAKQDAIIERCRRDDLAHVQIHYMRASQTGFELECHPPLPGVAAFPPGGPCSAR